MTAARHEGAPRAAEAAARRSYGKLVAFLAARTRDVAGAEDALSEAFASALAQWPAQGVPDNPEAWLLTVARRRLVDAVRGRIRAEEAAADVAWLEALGEDGDDGSGAGELADRRLELLFACAHPRIDSAMHAPLMLQAVLGLDAATIASSFLVAPAAMSQRLVRAKARIKSDGLAFEVPPLARLPERLQSVLAAIYAAYAEGWSDPLGADAQRRNLVDEALWLSHLLVELMPGEPEALGLRALLLYSSARQQARRDAQGRYVPLGEQDTARWDHAAIDEAESLLQAAGRMNRIGRYQLEAAVQSAHCVRRRTGQADWTAIVGFYAALHELTGSPVAALNHAASLARSGDPSEALCELDRLGADGSLRLYQPYWAARADLLARTGRTAEAAQAYRQALGLERDEAVRRFLAVRLAALENGSR